MIADANLLDIPEIPIITGPAASPGVLAVGESPV